MTLKIRYMIGKDQIYTIRMPIDSTVQELINEINNKHKSTEYKYVYSKTDGCNIDEESYVRDYYYGDESIYYILKTPDFNIKDFESDDSNPSDDDPPKNKKEDESTDSNPSDDDPPKNKKEDESTDSNPSDDDPPKNKKEDESTDDSNPFDDDPTIGNEKPLDKLLETQLGNVFKIVLKPKHAKENYENKEDFYVYSTQNYERMTDPVNIKIPLSSNYKETEQKIREEMEISEELQMHIYLSSGVRFFKIYKEEENVLNNFFNNTDTNHNIYVVVTKKIDDEILEKEIDEVCNAKDEMRSLVSPICETTQIGYSRIACLLGTFFYKGMNTLKFIRSIARCTGFAPLVSCLLALDNRETINGLTIATITASLHTIFSKLLEKATIKKEKIFERCLECACYLVHIEETYVHACENKRKEPIQIVIDKLDIYNDSNDITQYLLDCNQKNSFFPYYPDIRYVNDFEIALINKVPSINQIEYIFNNFASFRPIPPLSAREIHVTCIMQYINNQTLLLINASDDTENPYSVNVIDPFKGEIETRSIIEISEEILKNQNGQLELLFDLNDIEEFNAIILDASGSMLHKISDGNTARKDDINRAYVAKKCIRTFLKMSLLYRLPHLFSLFYFNSITKLVAKFSPLSSEIEKSLIDDSIKFRQKSKVWDAISDAIASLDELKETGKFKNAKLRILVFSDGCDLGSEKNKEDVCRTAIEKNIIVDSIIFAINKSCDDLCKFSRFTGGYSYKSNNENDFYSFFEKESFLNLKLRNKDRKSVDPKEVAKLFTTEEAKYDNDIANVDFITQGNITKISTPNYIMEKCFRKDKSEFHRYQFRLLKEMRIFELKNDKNVKLYIKYFDIEKLLKRDTNEEEGFLTWKIFMKGPPHTRYENYWWSLSIKFTKDYPLQPPLFRFINKAIPDDSTSNPRLFKFVNKSIPYHINVSEDGRICASFLLSYYNANDSIYDLIDKVRKLLAEPEEKYAIQEYKLNLYKNEKHEFKKKVDEYCKNAYKNFDECIKYYEIVDDKTKFSPSENDFEDNDNFISNVSQVFTKTFRNLLHHEEEDKTDYEEDVIPLEES